MASIDLKGMNREELTAAQDQIAEHLKKFLLEDIDQKERELNELRAAAGLRQRPLTSTVEKRVAGAKKTWASKDTPSKKLGLSLPKTDKAAAE